MPERIVSAVSEWGGALGFFIVGALISVGQLMASTEVLTLRIVIGRALSSGGLAMAAGAVVVWIPDLPYLAQIGVASLLASLGTSGLERLFSKILQARS